MNQQPQYNNLTEILLLVVRKMPGMYLGKNHISLLPNLIIGYMLCDGISGRPTDFYFGEDGFIAWYEKKYAREQQSFWDGYFLDEAGNDQVKALDIYFQRLEEFYEWYQNKK